MENIRKKYIILILALIITSLLVNYLQFDIYNKADEGVKTISKIPIEFQTWHGKDLPMDDMVYEILETKSIIHRSYYSDNNQNVFLSLVYYPETKVDFHSPAGCLAATGQVLIKTKKKIFITCDDKQKEIAVNQLTTGQAGRETLVYYFYKAGKYMGDDYIKLRFNLALSKFSQNTKSGSLIRVSIPIKEHDKQKSAQILRDFIQDIYPYLIKHL